MKQDMWLIVLIVCGAAVLIAFMVCATISDGQRIRGQQTNAPVKP